MLVGGQTWGGGDGYSRGGGMEGTEGSNKKRRVSLTAASQLVQARLLTLIQRVVHAPVVLQHGHHVAVCATVCDDTSNHQANDHQHQDDDGRHNTLGFNKGARRRA
jgi:hypothetical protein